MKKTFLTLTLSFLFCLYTFAQSKAPEARIVAGPMLGYCEYRECLVWVQSACNSAISIRYKEEGSATEKELQLTNKNSNTCEPWIARFVLPELKPNTRYSYNLYLDKKPVSFPYPLRFKTKKVWATWSKEDPYDFNFLFGSCNYVNDSAYDRPGKPFGQGTEIFGKMAEMPADFMIWLGDNTYLREADFTSASGIRYRYLHTRKDKNLQKFLSQTSHLAIWDDHDFGDNDASKSFDMNSITKECFVNYWGNRSYGENGKGIYSSFVFSDAEFFMLDDRTFRDESALDESKFSDKTMLGEAQLHWLKDKLKHSLATFKIICVGGQVMNTETNKESFNLYKRERAELLRFIFEQKIKGVLFLSGDRHHTEILKYDTAVTENGQPYKLLYPLIDITSSAMTAGPNMAILNREKEKESGNPYRIANTLVAENNFCEIKISGKRNERILQIICYDKGGIVKWTHLMKESELKPQQ